MIDNIGRCYESALLEDYRTKMINPEIVCNSFLKEVITYLEDIQYDRGLTVELYNHSHRAEEAIDEVAAYFNEHHPHLLRK